MDRHSQTRGRTYSTVLYSTTQIPNETFTSPRRSLGSLVISYSVSQLPGLCVPCAVRRVYDTYRVGPLSCCHRVIHLFALIWLPSWKLQYSYRTGTVPGHISETSFLVLNRRTM